MPIVKSITSPNGITVPAASVWPVTLFNKDEPIAPVGSLMETFVDVLPINPALATFAVASAEVMPERFGTVPLGRSSPRAGVLLIFTP